MKRLPAYLFILLLMTFGACSRGGRIIPRSDMSKIYAEMFLMDARIEEQSWTLRKIADTSQVYEPIFNKYGYTTVDFLASQEKYIEDANRYCRMLKKSVKIVETEGKELKKKRDVLQALRRAAANTRRYAPNRIYLMDTLHLDSLYRDSLFNFDFQKGMDTMYVGPLMIVWRDTMGLSARLQEQVRLDSLRRDSLRLDSLRLEEQKRTGLRPRPTLKSHVKAKSAGIDKKDAAF